MTSSDTANSLGQSSTALDFWQQATGKITREQFKIKLTMVGLVSLFKKMV